MVACVALLLLGRELLSTSSPPSPATGTTDANPELVFIALGDWGMPRHHQEEVAEALTRVARKVRPEFIVSLGDNFYPVGVRSTEDMQWRERFEEIYAKPPLIVPWHITLGDHDHQGSIDAQLLYSNISKRWKLPSPYYTFKKGGAGTGRPSVHFTVVDSVGLEGAYLQNGDKRRFAKNLNPKYTDRAAGEAQVAWLGGALKEGASSDWQVVIGYRPVLTGGLRDRTAVENRTAGRLRDILEASPAQLWMNGHDHTQQLLQASSGLRYFVSGGGGYNLHNITHLPETVFAGSFHGFLVHRVTRSAWIAEFHDTKGGIRYTTTIPNGRV
eukprot:TRINITY_DN37326_c0_g1_i2.p1 TRINITY_DN37326_c0_g1~~TRINITY_DN37326_c0_g1_i2.p1  ORF type:complete len:338 (+),score=128.17 TRINITY_DN37326_c0_g1_i2:31-1014(+)